MNRYSETVKVLLKYALLMIVLYAIENSIVIGLNTLNKTVLVNLSPPIKTWIPIAVVIMGNIITMFYVLKDKRKFQIENRYLEVLTLCFRPLGVCILLIQMVLENRSQIVENNELKHSGILGIKKGR